MDTAGKPTSEILGVKRTRPGGLNRPYLVGTQEIVKMAEQMFLRRVDSGRWVSRELNTHS